MATIPMGNFGQRVARPAQGVDAQRLDVSSGARAVQAVGEGIIDHQAALRAREEAKQRAEQERQDAEVRNAALRAQTMRTLTSTNDALADLHDSITAGIADGTVPKDKAETMFREQASKLTSEAGNDLPDTHRPIVQAEIEGGVARLGNGVRKAVLQRDRQDVTGGIVESLEHLKRQYKADPAGATQKADLLIDDLGPHSTMSPEQLVKLKQGWREETQFTTGYEAVSAGRNDRKALATAEDLIAKGLPDLDPQKKASLMDRAQAYRLHLDQQDELRASRAARAVDARFRQAEAEFKTFQAMADKGTVLDPAYIDRVSAATAGTPYQGGVRALAEQAKTNGGLANQSLTVQQATLDAIDAHIATNGRSPETDRRREQVEKVLDGTKKDVMADPLRAGLQRGWIADLKPIDMRAGIPGVVQQLTERTKQAELVRAKAGGPVSPFTPEEAEQVGRMISTLPPEQFGGAIALLSGSMPDEQAQALAKQIDKKDSALARAFAIGTQRTTESRYTAELVWRGDRVLKEKTYKEDKDPVSGVQSRIVEEVGTALSGPARDQVIEAARLIYIAKDSAGEKVTAKGAVALALGGGLVDHNGQRLPVPAGVDLDGLREKLTKQGPVLAKQAPDGMVYSLTGKHVTAAQFAASLPTAQLIPAGTGRYFVMSEDGIGVALNAQGQKIIVDVR